MDEMSEMNGSEARPAVNEAVREYHDGNEYELDIDALDIETCQQRVKIDEQTVADYTDVLINGGKLPPIDVWWDGWQDAGQKLRYWVSDGVHRVRTYRRAERLLIPAVLHIGTLRDAVLASVGANARHGLRRTNEDKRKAVMTMLNDEEWCQWSDRAIARHCGVSHPTVAAIRQELSGKDCQIERTVQRGGTTYTMTIPPPPLRRPVPPPPAEQEYPESWDEPLLPDDPDGYAGDDGADYSDGADADQPDTDQPDQTDADQPDYAAVTRIYPAAEPSAPPRRVAPPPPRVFNGPDEGATGIGGGGGGAVPGMAGASLESPLPVASQAEPGELLEDWMRLTETVARLVPMSWLEDMSGYLSERIAARRG